MNDQEFREVISDISDRPPLPQRQQGKGDGGASEKTYLEPSLEAAYQSHINQFFYGIVQEEESLSLHISPSKMHVSVNNFFPN